MSTRNEVVSIAKSYVGCKQGSDKHKKLVDTFNKVRPHGERGNYSCAWCAITWSAFQILAGNTSKNVPLSYNCGTLINDAKKLGVWVENDAYVPSPGDGIIYSWNDDGKGDCKTGASHVGTVEKVEKGKITIIEGNKGTSKACGRRVINVNSRYIRGFICPKYGANEQKTSQNDKKTSDPAQKASTTPTYSVGKTYKVTELGDSLNVRTGPGVKYAVKAKKDLTKDGQKHSNARGQLKKGTKVTCQQVSKNNGNIWMKIPSGWVCAYYQGKKYIG